MLAVIMIVSIVFAACGGGGTTAPPPSDSGAPAPAPAPAAPAENTGEVFTVRIGCATVLPSHPNWFMEELKVALEAKSDQFVVELYPANQLGPNPEMLQGLQSGNIQGVVLPTGLFTSLAPVFNVLAVPGLVPSADAQYNMLNNSAVGDAFKAEVSKAGVTPLGFLWCPSQEFYLNKAATDIGGLNGLKVRGPDAKVSQDMMTSYGISPVVMSSGDVVMGLQQGTIDGVFTDCTFAAPMKVHEKASYILRDLPGVPNSNTVMISNIFLDSLPADLRAIFEETVAEVRERTQAYTVGYENDCYSLMESEGAEILTPSADFIAACRAEDAATQETFLADNPQFADIFNLVADWVAANA